MRWKGEPVKNGLILLLCSLVGFASLTGPAVGAVPSAPKPWKVQGDLAYADFGRSVATAGDVKGTGSMT